MCERMCRLHTILLMPFEEHCGKSSEKWNDKTREDLKTALKPMLTVESVRSVCVLALSQYRCPWLEAIHDDVRAMLRDVQISFEERDRLPRVLLGPHQFHPAQPERNDHCGHEFIVRR